MFKQPLASAMLSLVFIFANPNAPGAQSPPDTSGDTVKIDNFTFNPPRLLVKLGTTVVWINQDDIPHTVASTTKLFRSKALDTEDHFSFTFSTPGVYEYFCSLHPHMRGTIVVEAEHGT